MDNGTEHEIGASNAIFGTQIGCDFESRHPTFNREQLRNQQRLAPDVTSRAERSPDCGRTLIATMHN